MSYDRVKRTCNDLIMFWLGSRGVKRVGTTRGRCRTLQPGVAAREVARREEGQPRGARSQWF